MNVLYKRYIPPKATQSAPAKSTAVAPPPQPQPRPKFAAVPTDAPPKRKRKRERTEEEVAERKAKKLKKKGIDPATVLPPQTPGVKDVAPAAPVLNEDVEKDDTAAVELRGEFANVRSNKKRHKLEKEAREARKAAKKVEGEAAGDATDGLGVGEEFVKPEGSAYAFNGLNSPSAPREQQGRVLPSGDDLVNGGAEVAVLNEGTGTTSRKEKKEKKNKKDNEDVAKRTATAVDEVEAVPTPQDTSEDKVMSRPKKRRHKLESILQQPPNDQPQSFTDNAPDKTQDHLKNHTTILKTFHQSSQLSKHQPKPRLTQTDVAPARPTPIILPLAPLPQPAPTSPPIFTPNPSLPSWIANPITITNSDTAPFASLNLSPHLTTRLSNLGFTTALPVQKMLLPLLLPPGEPGARYVHGTESVFPDLAVSAPTGSGKTIAYLLPIIASLERRGITIPRGRRLCALILVPTRELVAQVAAVAQTLAKRPSGDGSEVKIGTATGMGLFKDEQAKLVNRSRTYDPETYANLLAKAHKRNYPPAEDSPDLAAFLAELEHEDEKHLQHLQDIVDGSPGYIPVYESAVDLLIATPGRLMEHLRRTLGFSLRGLDWVVLDEADKLVEDGAQYAGVLEAVDSAIERKAEQGGRREVYLKENGLWDERRDAKRVRKVICSATLTRDMGKLGTLRLRRPSMVVVRGEGEDVANGDEKGGFEVPSGLSEFWVGVGDGGEKALVLVELLQTRILSMEIEGKGVSEEDAMEVDGSIASSSEEEDDSDSASSISSDSIPSSSSSEEEDDDDDSNTASSLSETLPPANIIAVDTAGRFSPPLHPSRAALLPATTSALLPEVPTILTFTSSTETAHRLAHTLRLLLPDLAGQIHTMTSSGSGKKSGIPPVPSTKPLLVISTDRTARGLDTLGKDNRWITHVIQYDLPRSVEGYVHRVGRTARAGRRGQGWSLVCGGREGRWWGSEVIDGKGIRRRGGVEKVVVKVGDRKLRKRFEGVVEGIRGEVFAGGPKGKIN